MAKKNTPAWQQVVLTVLNGMYSVKDGHDAWNKLNDEEKAAVMDFLTEHCGENAQAALDEICAMARPSRLSEGLGNFLGLVGAVAIYLIYRQASDWLSSIKWLEPLQWLWILLLFGLYIFSIFSDDRPSRMRELWRDRENCNGGPKAALNGMYRVTQMSRWQAMDKGMLMLRLILFGVLLAVSILNLYAFYT